MDLEKAGDTVQRKLTMATLIGMGDPEMDVVGLYRRYIIMNTIYENTKIVFFCLNSPNVYIGVIKGSIARGT